uniref:Replicative DNA helicase n=1 Tax=Toxarium undulatum TaxID=210620 RepID=A0A1D8D9F9_9STRA|nr:replication helicase subunit [Toxarium undulatum]AOS86588.1 replication helicase subunit [Toxarium undulatum]
MKNSNTKTVNIIIEKYLPHNFLAEKTVLSSLLINSNAIGIAIQTLTKESFYFKNHQQIYNAILDMYSQNLPIDIITLNTYLQDKGLLNKIGGLRVLIELINQVPNLVYLEEYIRLIQDKFVRRQLIKLGYELINTNYITNISLENILQDLESQLFVITNKIKNQRISNTTELLSEIFVKLKENSIQPNLSGLASGFYDLDSLTQGFQTSDLIIIAGRPSTGKTALCLNLALNILKQSKLPVLFFSLEMSKEQLIYRLISSEAKINLINLRNGNLYRNDWLNLSKSIKNLSKLLFFIDDSPTVSTENVRATIKKIIFEHNKLGLIIIDYLQLMQNKKSKIENRVQELSQITRALKTIAREFNVPLIALSQLNRNVEVRLNKKPILSDLRESGSIEQDADLVLMLYKQNEYTIDKNNQITELIIAKQRNGPIGTIKLNFNTNYVTFSDLNSLTNDECPEPDSNW